VERHSSVFPGATFEERWPSWHSSEARLTEPPRYETTRPRSFKIGQPAVKKCKCPGNYIYDRLQNRLRVNEAAFVPEHAS
jgi:hypothetical protein